MLLGRISRRPAAAVLAASLIASAAHGADPAVRCETGKLKEAGKYANCRLKAEAKGVQRNVAPDYSKCDEKFSDKWDRIEAHAGADVCPIEFDKFDISDLVVDNADAIATLQSGVRYQDCGNGTVADVLKGLVWEKKTDCGGGGVDTVCTDDPADCPDPHCVDQTYTWTATDGRANGRAYSVFLSQLNGAFDASCFTNRCDWRIPTSSELSGLRTCLYGTSCLPWGSPPYPIPDLGEEGADSYWTNETAGFATEQAFLVHEWGDDDNASVKTTSFRVRAVRNGSCP